MDILAKIGLEATALEMFTLAINARSMEELDKKRK